MSRLIRSMTPAVLALLLLTPIADAADADYVAGIQTWRQEFDADVRSGGWLALIGRLKLEDGRTTLGSDSGSTLILPPQAPRQLGTVTRHASALQFEPASDVQATVDGNPVSGPCELGTKSGTGRVRVGSYLFSVRAVGDDFYLLLRDSQNPAITEFKGNTWFPINPHYRVAARFIPYVHPQQVPMPLTHVDSKELLTSTGDVTFKLAGRTIRLKSFIDEDQLFVMFQDPTNGKQTYGGGRFLHAPLPQDGRTVLDFNKAFNPYCSVNVYVMCPVPPPGNRIDSRVTAGEMFQGHD
jgi:uncharacterized protein (DUF1684 family)